MKSDHVVARREYLSYLQGFYEGLAAPDLGLPKDSAGLRQVIQHVIREKGISEERSSEEILRLYDDWSSLCGIFDSYIQREVAKLLTAFGKDNRQQIVDNVTFGSIPLADLNGMCVIVPEGAGYLVLINQGTLAYCEVVAGLISGLTRFQTSQNDTVPKFSDEAAAKFLVAFTASFPYISPMLHRKWTNFRHVFGTDKSGIDHFCPALGDGLTNYVIAHEISHFVRGHFSDITLRAVPIGSNAVNTVNVEAVEYQHVQELEADVLGSAILVIGHENTCSEVDAIAVMVATQVFFLALDLMEQIQHRSDKSHPTAHERRHHLLRELDYREDVLTLVSFYENSVFAEAKSRAAHRARALSLAESGNSSMVSGQYQDAATYLSEAELVAEKSGDVTLEIDIRRERASVFMQLPDYDAAIDEYQQIEVLAGDLRDIKDGDDVFVQMAKAYSKLGKLDKGIDNLKRALIIVKERGESRWEGRYLYSLGLLLGQSNDYWEALRCFSQAWAILSSSNEEDDRKLTGLLSEGMVKIRASIMQQILNGSGDMDSKRSLIIKLLHSM